MVDGHDEDSAGPRLEGDFAEGGGEGLAKGVSLDPMAVLTQAGGYALAMVSIP